MLTLTHSAYTRLTELLASDPAETAVRIVRQAGRMRLRRSTAREGDEVFLHSGRPVLLLDEPTARHLEQARLDVHETNDGPRLRCRRPRQSTAG